MATRKSVRAPIPAGKRLPAAGAPRAAGPRPVLTRAVLLGAAAGNGRCGLAAVRPSYLWPIANEPAGVHLVRALHALGIGEVIVCGGEAGDGPQARRMRLEAEALGMVLRWAVETAPTGTGGALRALGSPGPDEHVLVACGHIRPSWVSPALRDLHFASGADATVLVSRAAGRPVDTLDLDAEGRVTGARLGDGSPDDWTSEGLWLLGPAALRRIPATGFYSIREQMIPELVDQGRTVHAVRSRHVADDAGRARRYRRQNEQVLRLMLTEEPGYRRIAPRVWAADDVRLGRDAVLAGPVLIGAGCTVGDGARLVGPVAIGEGCTIGPGASVSRCVLWDGVTVGRGASATDAVLTDGAALPPQGRVDGAVVVAGRGGRLNHLGGATAGVLVAEGRRLHPLSRPSLRRRAADGARRAADVAVAATVLLATAPLLLLAAAAIVLDSRGPIFFRQNRCGRGGRVFGMLKLRTMVADAERRRPDLQKANEVDGPMFKMARDPRVTRVGAVLRRTCIDELPQMINILCGHMSLVGPRPLAPHEMALGAAWRDIRLSVRPGATGLWQVRSRLTPTFAEWIALDSLYVARRSLLLDLRILLETPAAVVRRVFGRQRPAAPPAVVTGGTAGSLDSQVESSCSIRSTDTTAANA
ncbi:MAG: hypothetical protein GX591_20210 [Planctomycetes bacterium]|nr:hypothetical protein [Planctomycetota bacterium]